MISLIYTNVPKNSQFSFGYLFLCFSTKVFWVFHFIKYCLKILILNSSILTSNFCYQSLIGRKLFRVVLSNFRTILNFERMRLGQNLRKAEETTSPALECLVVLPRGTVIFYLIFVLLNIYSLWNEEVNRMLWGHLTPHSCVFNSLMFFNSLHF